MGERSVKITKRIVEDIAPNGSDFYIFDTMLIGFGIRVRASGSMSYIVRYRSGFGRNAPVRRVTIAKVGKVAPEQARKAARDILASVVKGGDPARERTEHRKGATLAQLSETFLVEHAEKKRRASTAASYRLLLDKHVLPQLGTRKANSLTVADVEKIHLGMEATPAAANRVRAILSSMYAWAMRTGRLKPMPNPASAVESYDENKRERFLTTDEIGRLAEALRAAETDGFEWEPDPTKKTKHARKPGNRVMKIDPHAAAAIRLLMLTGARLREILHLRWDNVDFERGMLFLPTSKTGKKEIVLNAPALAVLSSLERVGGYVIAGETAGTKDEKPRADLKRPWALVTKRAGLDGLRIHDLRHSFASFGAGGGMGLPIIGKLLGHAQASTTQRYAHLDADPLRRAADAIGAAIAGAMGEAPARNGEAAGPAEIIPLKRKDA